MNKIILRLSLVALIACVMTMGALSFTSQLAYSTHVQSKKTLNGGFAEAVVKTDGKTYSLDGRYDVEINDDNTLAIKQNSEANNNKKIKLNENDDLTIDFKCKDNDCKQTARHGEYKFISVYLVDKNEKNIDIAKENQRIDNIKSIGSERCFKVLVDCDLTVTVDDNIKDGQYKFVINAAYDEGNVYYISPAKIHG